MDDEAKRREHVLLITRNLPPLLGGMERLVRHIAQSLAERCELAVIGPQGCEEFLPKSVRVQEVPYRPLPRFLLAASLAVRRIGRRHHALVVSGSGLTMPMAWWAARRTGAISAVYLHGLDIIAPSWLYQHVWLPFIRRADVVFVNSRNTGLLAIAHGVRADVIEVLNPGTDLPLQDERARQRFRDLHGLGARPVMLSVGRLTPRKGLARFIRHAMPLILVNVPDAVLLVIGADATDAVARPADSEQQRILDSARDAGVEAAVRMLPPCDDQTLSDAYRAADVHVFPVLDVPGDVEGFGMVAIEAAAHGLPTVAFAVGGVPDAVSNGVSGYLLQPGDYEDFARRVVDLMGAGQGPVMREGARAFAASFEWCRFSERLWNTIDQHRR